MKELSGYTPTRLLEIVRTCIDFPCGVIQTQAPGIGDLFARAPRRNSSVHKQPTHDGFLQGWRGFECYEE